MAPESLIGHPGLKSRNLKHFVHFYNNDSGLADEVAGLSVLPLSKGIRQLLSQLRPIVQRLKCN